MIRTRADSEAGEGVRLKIRAEAGALETTGAGAGK